MKIIQLVLLIVTALHVSCVKQVKNTDRNTTPNIILIMADDMGYGDLGCYGQAGIYTPHIDKLASEGMKLTRFYAASTVCAPSRSGLVTGKHMGHAVIRGNGNHALPMSEVTIAEPLKKAGYSTAVIGKWGLGDDVKTGPDKHGFDYYYGYLNQIHAHNYYPDYLIENGDSVRLYNVVSYMDSSHWTKGLGGYAIEKHEYSNDLFTDKALQIIDTASNAPFFIYLPYTIPHNNGEAPIGERQEVPDNGQYEELPWDKEQKGYAAMISRLDSYLGEIINKLEERNLDKNTIIFFTSDNGPMNEKDFCQYFDSNGNLRGGKRDLYEGGIRVPGIAWWPGKIKSASSDVPLASWDLLPTFCDLAGTHVPDGIDGESFITVLFNNSKLRRKTPLYWEYSLGKKGFLQAVQKDDWKLISFTKEGSPPRYELYNVAMDRGETNDLASSHPGKVDELLTIMKNSRTPSDLYR